MASAVTHFIVAASLALPAMESGAIRKALPRWAVPVTAGILAVAPDLDIFRHGALSMPFSNLWGHRGVFHSPFFLLLLCAALAFAAGRKHGLRTTVWLAALWTGCAITHPILDALTDGGAGVLLLFPFDTKRMFFAWQPIHVSPIGSMTYLARASRMLWSELPFCLAAAAAGVGGLLMQRLNLRTGFAAEAEEG